MTALIMPRPYEHFHFHRGHPWQPEPEQPHSQQHSVALPSIRQVLPEFSARTHAPASSPTEASTRGTTSPDYVHSPSSSRQLRTVWTSESERDDQVPRGWNTSNEAREEDYQPSLRTPAPWHISAPVSPAGEGYPLPSMQHYPTPEARVSHASTSDAHGYQGYSGNGHHQGSRRPSVTTSEAHVYQGYPGNSYHAHGSRTPSVTSSYSHASEREQAVYSQADSNGQTGPASDAYALPTPNGTGMPFIASYGPGTLSPSRTFGRNGHYSENRTGHYSGQRAGPYSETRHRRRRGNLPKETTERLRGWFLTHLHHPYPTEDEKNELMRITGLQINQISNWFINARRRQLPTIMNGARAESNAMATRRNSNGLRASTERPEYDSDMKMHSDGEVNCLPFGSRRGNNSRGSV
ncbi:hypothetical protein GGR52DRAFT_240933 [Hypoxylon sp. FL1284]|nr:hypothetical protein GGR52DRAFT_240933 [Hypoxylon sp. FL1284]